MNTGTAFYIILLCCYNRRIYIYPFPVASEKSAAVIEQECDYIYALRCRKEEVDAIYNRLSEVVDATNIKLAKT